MKHKVGFFFPKEATSSICCLFFGKIGASEEYYKFSFIGDILKLNLLYSDELVLDGQCDANLVLRWMTEVGSSIYATPILHDLYSDGQMDIIVPSFVHLLEVTLGIHLYKMNLQINTLSRLKGILSQNWNSGGSHYRSTLENIALKMNRIPPNWPILIPLR